MKYTRYNSHVILHGLEKQDVKGMEFRHKTRMKLGNLFAVHEVTIRRLSVIYGYSIALYKISSSYISLQCLTLTLDNLTTSSGTNFGVIRNKVSFFFYLFFFPVELNYCVVFLMILKITS